MLEDVDGGITRAGDTATRILVGLDGNLGPSAAQAPNRGARHSLGSFGEPSGCEEGGGEYASTRGI